MFGIYVFLMLSETFCYWEKQQSADSNIVQFHLTLKSTKDQSLHFCDCFLVSKWNFQPHDCGLTKFHTGSEQPLPLVCVVISNSSYPTVKNNHRQGRNEGRKGGTIPRAPIHYGGAESLQGRRITAGGAETSQQCHTFFLQYSKFAFERTQIWT